MSKKNPNTQSAASDAQRNSSTKPQSSLSTVPATSAELLSLLGSEIAVAKLFGVGGAVSRDEDIVLVTGRSYATPTCVLPAKEIYYDRREPTSSEAHRLGEADKISWRDPSSGYVCIVLRDADRGFLRGFVGVPPGHPLWGWHHSAVPTDIGPEVHGGLNCSQINRDECSPVRDLRRDAQKICHVSNGPPFFGPNRFTTDHRAENSHIWWFGFSCDHAHDLVPSDEPFASRTMAPQTGKFYRDDGYVARETIALAAQLRAIDDCESILMDAPSWVVGAPSRRGGSNG